MLAWTLGETIALQVLATGELTLIASRAANIYRDSASLAGFGWFTSRRLPARIAFCRHAPNLCFAPDSCTLCQPKVLAVFSDN